MTGSLKFEVDRHGRWVLHTYLYLNLGWWLVHWNLISAVLVDGWCTDTWSQPPWLMAGSHLTWSQPRWLIVSLPKFGLDRSGRWLVHWHLISATLVDGCFTLNLISTTYVDDWFIEIWTWPSWSIAAAHLTLSQPWLMAASLKLDLGRLGRLLFHWNLISTTSVDDWFTATWSPPSWSIAGSLKLDLNHMCWGLVHWNLISTALV